MRRIGLLTEKSMEKKIVYSNFYCDDFGGRKGKKNLDCVILVTTYYL